MNNIHALVKDDKIADFDWVVKDTDTIYAWRATNEKIDKISVKKREIQEGGANEDTLTFELPRQRASYVYLINWVGGSLQFLNKLEDTFTRALVNAVVTSKYQVFAKLLCAWISGSTNEDPWNATDKSWEEVHERNKGALELEKNIRDENLKVVKPVGQDLMMKCCLKYGKDIVVALNSMQMWTQATFWVKEIEASLKFTEAEFKLRTEIKDLEKKDNEHYTNHFSNEREKLVNNAVLEKKTSELEQFRAMEVADVLWKKLGEAQGDWADVGNAVIILNDSTGAAYEQLKALAVDLQEIKKMNNEETILEVQRLTKARHVAKTKREHSQQQLAQLLAERAHLVKMEFLSSRLLAADEAISNLSGHSAQMLKVFGEKIDTEINAGCSEKCSGCSKTDAARRMVDAVRRMGWENTSDTVAAINNIQILKEVLMKLLSSEDFPEEIRKLNFRPYALPHYTERIRKFPQMSFYYKLDPTHLDVLLPLHFLLMNALKSAFAAPGDVQQLSWKLVPPKAVDFDEDSTNPAFVANQNLLNIPIPEFVLDHWKETMEKKTTKKKTTKKKTMKEVTDEGAGTN
eukprot:GHVS01049987.1.p1 GENE.GHVS01049987.1~~GHVS01049987.1.p1  ORF type:complete len:574 (-),score=77.46 GHVS01049987.1:80-1801(-)